MALTAEELIGTTWQFNETLSFDGAPVPHGYIDFESNGEDFSGLYPDGYAGNVVRYDDTYVYDNGWLLGENDNYRTISILNVRSVSPKFIDFLESNAEQVVNAYQFVDNIDSWTGSVEVKKKSGTKIVINTDSKYLNKDIEISVSVKNGTATTPETVINVEPAITMDSTGLITVSCGANRNVVPTIIPGYISKGVGGTISVTGSNSYQVPVATISETKTYLGIT